MAESKDQWFFHLVFHLTRGPVIVRKVDILNVMQTKNLPEACMKLSRVTPRYVDYYPGVARSEYVRLEMEEPKNG